MNCDIAATALFLSGRMLNVKDVNQPPEQALGVRFHVLTTMNGHSPTRLLKCQCCDGLPLRTAKSRQQTARQRCRLSSEDVELRAKSSWQLTDATPDQIHQHGIERQRMLLTPGHLCDDRSSVRRRLSML